MATQMDLWRQDDCVFFASIRPPVAAGCRCSGALVLFSSSLVAERCRRLHATRSAQKAVLVNRVGDGMLVWGLVAAVLLSVDRRS